MAAPPAPAVSEPDGAGDRAESDMTSEGVQTQEQADPTPPADLQELEIVCAEENTSLTNQIQSAPAKLKFDPSKVLAAQMQALESLREEHTDQKPSKETKFTKWLDQSHKTWFFRMDNWVRNFDTRWLPEGSDYDYMVSSFSLNLIMRAGGRGNEKNYDAKARFNARLALPAIEKELYLFIDNSGRDSLPGSDPLAKESDTRLGLRAVRQFMDQSEIDIGGGVRLRSSGPVLYADVEWRWVYPGLGGEWVLRPRGFYYSDDGFGQMTTVVWTRPTKKNQALQFRLAERSTEQTGGLEFEQTVRYAWYRSDHKRGWMTQASLFPHMKHSQLYWDDAILNLTYRGALYKKWIYYKLTPQLDFAKEDDYKARASLWIGLQILFGGEPADLM